MTTPEDDSRYARLAATLLSRRAHGDAAAMPARVPDRGASVAAIQRALRARTRRRAARWLGWGAAAAAAAVLLAVGWRSLRSSQPVDTRAVAPVDGSTETKLAVADVEGSATGIETPQGMRAASRGDRIAAGTIVRVFGPGALVLALDTGTRLRVGASSRVRPTSLGAVQRFDIESGTLEADVAKVRPGGRFIVATSDAEVEVKGTRFEVTVAATPSPCAPFARTRVTVQEGVVVVRSGGGEIRLPAGSAWPDCPAGTAAPLAHGRTHLPHPAPAAANPTSAPIVDPSTLAEQNDLFAAALAARRRGQIDEAVRWFDRLIARYPKGQLINTARAERQRLLDQRRERARSE
jgi:hypothetical protein